jgi:hypothetical protein
MINLNDYKKKIHSQDGEDGIIEKIFETLGIKNGWYCEFGAGDGNWISNTRYLRELGWNGVLIEGDDPSFENLKNNYSSDKSLTLIKKYVDCEPDNNLDSILKNTKIPKEFDLLSIDVDGNDLWIWKSIENYNPKVVVVEYNCDADPESSLTIKYDPSHRFCENNYYGATAGAFNKLAKEKGYKLVASTDGLNLFYCREDLALDFKEMDLSLVYRGKVWPFSNKEMIEY